MFVPCARVFTLSMIVVASVHSSARAYCRTHTKDGQGTCPVFACTDRGVPLAWHSAQISYAFNQAGVPGMSDGQLRSTFEQAFQTWADVRCDGKPVGFEFTQLPGVTSLQEGSWLDGGNTNVITHYTAEAWADMDYAADAFALTPVYYNDAGVIAGADMDLNGGWDLFGDCELNLCSRAGIQTDLQNVVTHEAGHFLGLSHSQVDASTMNCSADPQDTNKRTLEQDDIDGLCAAYPRGKSFPDDKKHDGCSIAPGARGAATPAAFALLLAAFARRRYARGSARRNPVR